MAWQTFLSSILIYTSKERERGLNALQILRTFCFDRLLLHLNMLSGFVKVGGILQWQAK